MTTMTVEDLGSIKSFTLPSDWARSERFTWSGHSITFSNADYEGTRISYLAHENTISSKSQEAFEQVLNSPQNLPKPLYSETSKSAISAEQRKLFNELAPVLGLSNVGDNQLTSQTDDAFKRKAAFHLDSARVEEINGKRILAIDGWFSQTDEQGREKMEADAPSKRYYTGFFTPAQDKSGAKSVDELYLQSDSKMAFMANKACFRSAVKSIGW